MGVGWCISELPHPSPSILSWVPSYLSQYSRGMELQLPTARTCSLLTVSLSHSSSCCPRPHNWLAPKPLAQGLGRTQTKAGGQLKEHSMASQWGWCCNGENTELRVSFQFKGCRKQPVLGGPVGNGYIIPQALATFTGCLFGSRHSARCWWWYPTPILQNACSGVEANTYNPMHLCCGRSLLLLFTT